MPWAPASPAESLVDANVNDSCYMNLLLSLGAQTVRTDARPTARNRESTSLMTQRPADEQAEEKQAAADLLPVLYDELRRLAASLTTGLPPGQTLQPTALVHEAYLRLVKNKDPGWEGRRHFFGAAARAMREILIEQARQKASFKHGGKARRIALAEGVAWIEPPSGDLLALDEAIQQLNAEDARLGEIVQLRYYTGLSIEETASVVGASVSTLKRDRRFARAWLARRLDQTPP